MATEPRSSLARRVLPSPLYRALTHVFAQGLDGAMLVGGTALAGYYAGHRRSDDLDLFTRDHHSYRAMSLAVGSLAEIGASIETHMSSAQFYSTTCRLDNHNFTVQVVLDAHLFTVGSAILTDDGVSVATLPTLLRQKAATLVSRCSEKDLYDLQWLFREQPNLDLEALLELGREIDGGVNAESVLISLTGARLSAAACGFSMTSSASEVFEEISELRDALARGLEGVARNQPVPVIGELIRALKEPVS